MAEIVGTIKGAKKVGNLWRLPVVEMPVSYWLERGLLARPFFDPKPRTAKNVHGSYCSKNE
jgi:hypothetical protein